MKVAHTIVLTEAEIQRAIQLYCKRQTPAEVGEWEYSVQLKWRAKYALVEARRPIPTLTDAVERAA
jgi:hypothetical protein